MTPREVVKAAFRFEPTDEIPYWVSMDGGVAQRVGEHYGTPDWRQGRIKDYVWGGHFGFTDKPMENGLFMDAFGVLIQPGNILHIVRAPLERPSLNGYRWPEMSSLAVWDDMAREIADHPDLFHIRGLGFGLFERCHQVGLPLVLHSCGNLLPLVDDLMEIGLDGLESLQPEAMDLRELRRRTEGRMMLMGGVGVQHLMPFGKPDEVTREVRRLMQEMTRRGGYVLAPAKPLQADTPTANAVALVEAVMDNKRR